MTADKEELQTLKLERRNYFTVELIDSMGDDLRVVQAARVSTGHDDRTDGVERLIRYLLRNGHWSPFEHVFFTFRSEIPIWLARQVMRHQSHHFNEFSMRYSEALPAVWVPDRYHAQSNTMKQGRAEPLPEGLSKWLRNDSITLYQQAWHQYQWLINNQVAREQARGVLPVDFYTHLYTTMNLRSLIHFIGDRTDPTAQTEAAVYANQLKALAEPIVPITLKTWEEITSGK